MWWRAPLALILLTLAACCFFGFLAAGEPGMEDFRGPYALLGVGAAGAATWLLFRRGRRRHP